MTEATESENFILRKWQKCYFDLQGSQASPRVKVDTITGILQQVYQANAIGSISDDVRSNLARHYIKAHSSIVDSANGETGLNNYADGALTMCANHPNESSAWTTSLTTENIRDLSCVKQLLQSSKASAASKKPTRADEPLILNQNKKVVDQRSSSNPSSGSTSFASSHVNRQPTATAPSQQNYPTFNQNPQSFHASRPITSSANAANHPPGQSSTNQVSKGQGPTSYGQPPQTSTFSRTRQQIPNPRESHLVAPQFQDRTAPMPPSDPNLPRHHASAFPSQSTANRTQNRGQINDNPGPNYDGEPPKSSGFPSHQGYRPSGFTSTGAPPHSLKRKTMFQEVEFQGDGQLPFRTSVPERTGFADRRFTEGQGARHMDNEDESSAMPSAFKTANEQLIIQNQKKYGNRAGTGAPTSSAYGTGKKSLGTTRRGLNSKFVPPVVNREDGDTDRGQRGVTGRSNVTGDGEEEVTDERLKGIDPKMIELVMNEIMDHGPPIQWDDIAGLEFAKTTIKEIVVWPMLRPDIFNGLRGPPKGLLLFGPPGTGKTLIGKCIACQSGATFFSISASSLTSKWVGEGEKMVRALFAVSRCHQPAVIFIDEIDSLLSQRSNDEHESSRRIKTEFLVQLDGATTSSDDRLLVVGATNRPQEIDEAARRRLVKRLYIPLPEAPARRQIVQNLLAQQSYSLTEEELDRICQETDGYSGADMANLCREAALGPIRCIQGTDIQHISADQVRPILYEDFQGALQHMRPSVSKSDLNIYLEWNKTFGTGASK
ncbi:fidgetin-like protein 1 [Patiria miniata]|uniref:Fidgetin-like protein 1 n=1 Tax=Patiria miniata TaxID=46514 RepID=A0A913Z6B1_PATMI|nr:fidgetin-like protein 1 [Patiria miniata]XP_038046341.1 fidgetin-like protein 1 [Patiria miniata]XP_038046342.1 fidgetin-like protein 1 [Patiria miniata]